MTRMCPLCKEKTFTLERGIEYSSHYSSAYTYLANIWKCSSCGYHRIAHVYDKPNKDNQLDVKDLEKRMKEYIQSIGE